MNPHHNNVTVNGVEIMDASDLVEYPLDLPICIRRDVEEGRTWNDVEISNLDGWTGGNTINLGKGN